MTESNSLLRPAIAPSKGGLLIIGYDGSRVSVADSEVEAFFEDLQAVRKKQLVNDCRRIAGIDGDFHRVGPKGVVDDRT